MIFSYEFIKDAFLGSPMYPVIYKSQGSLDECYINHKLNWKHILPSYYSFHLKFKKGILRLLL